MRNACVLTTLALTALAAWQHTPQSQLFVDALCAALRAVGIAPKEAAHTQHLTEQQWSMQCSGRGGHVSLQRITALPAVAIRRWLMDVAPAYGLRCFDRNDDLVKLYDSNRQLVDTLTAAKRRTA